MDYVVESTQIGWAFGVQDAEPGPWGVRWWRRPLIVRNGSREIVHSTAFDLKQIAEGGRGWLSQRQPKSIARGAMEVLLYTQIALCGLYAGMA